MGLRARPPGARSLVKRTARVGAALEAVSSRCHRRPKRGSDGNHSGETGAARFPLPMEWSCGDGPQAALLGSPLRSALGSSDPRPAHCSWATETAGFLSRGRRRPGSWLRPRIVGSGESGRRCPPVPRTSACHRPGTPVSRHSSAVAQDEVEGRRPEHRRGFQLSSVPRHPPTAPTSRLGDWGRAAPNKHVTCLEQPGRLGPDLHSALFGVSGKQGATWRFPWRGFHSAAQRDRTPQVGMEKSIWVSQDSTVTQSRKLELPPAVTSAVTPCV
ncbi:hypothetical protein R6Z07F_014925 [Ovis aries]